MKKKSQGKLSYVCFRPTILHEYFGSVKISSFELDSVMVTKTVVIDMYICTCVTTSGRKKKVQKPVQD
jgi:hypothetical protein